MKPFMLTVTSGSCFVTYISAVVVGGVWVNQSAVNADRDVAVKSCYFFFLWEIIRLH